VALANEIEMTSRVRSPKHQSKRGLGTFSRRAISELDRRTVEALEEQRIIAELTEHVGVPTPPQRLLISASHGPISSAVFSSGRSLKAAIWATFKLVR
jgi:hypothetical protein